MEPNTDKSGIFTPNTKVEEFHGIKRCSKHKYLGINISDKRVRTTEMSIITSNSSNRMPKKKRGLQP